MLAKSIDAFRRQFPSQKEPSFPPQPEPTPIDDEWRQNDHEDHRESLAGKWLRGSGIEIGALHKPVTLPDGAAVTYVDYKSLEENRQRYPELANERIVETGIIDDGFTLDRVAPASQDFLVANHALEHSPDLLGTLKCWLSKLRPGGVLYFAVPMADRCFDRGRPLTTLEHIRQDHRDFLACDVDRVVATTAEHIHEFIRIADRNIRIENGMPLLEEGERMERFRDKLIGKLTARIASEPADYTSLMRAHIEAVNKVYDVHYHTFSPSSLLHILASLSGELGFSVADYVKSGSGETIAVLKKSEKHRLLNFADAAVERVRSLQGRWLRA